MYSLYLTSSVDTDGLISSSKPFYHVDRPCWFPRISDKALVLLAPFLTYWSLFVLYRLILLTHFSPAARRRRIRKMQPIRMAIEIQIVQLLFGWVWLTRFDQGERDVAEDLKAVGRFLGMALSCLMGKTNAQAFLSQNGDDLIQFTYWWAIPVAKQLFASLTIDAWQMLLHLFGVDGYLYADVHAFLFDTVGVCFAYSLSGISNREAAVLLVHSTLQSFGRRPRPVLPASSIHRRIPLDRECITKPVQNAPFMGFRRQLYQLLLVHWYAILGEPMLDMYAVESRRIRRAMYAAQHERQVNGQRTRPQLRLDMSCLR